jgi:hypothetical protein
MLPVEIISSNKYPVKISYDNNNRITKVNWYAGNIIPMEAHYAYNATGRLTSITYDGEYGGVVVDNVISFEYSGNYITNYVDGVAVLKYELQGDRATKIYEIKDDKEILRETFAYDSKGNPIKVLYENGNGYYSETTLTYADKKGVYSGINMPNWFLMMDWMTEGSLKCNAVNNPLLITAKAEYDGGEVIHSHVSYDYELYNNDYPEKFTITITDDYDYPAKKPKVFDILPSFNKQKLHTKRSSDIDVTHFEIKYIEAK